MDGRIESFVAIASKVLKTAAMLPFACGYAGKDETGNDINVHDHLFMGHPGSKKKPVVSYWTKDLRHIVELHDPSKHGPIHGWADENGLIPGVPTDLTRHHHSETSGSIGAHELANEKVLRKLGKI